MLGLISLSPVEVGVAEDGRERASGRFVGRGTMQRVILGERDNKRGTTKDPVQVRIKSVNSRVEY